MGKWLCGGGEKEVGLLVVHLFLRVVCGFLFFLSSVKAEAAYGHILIS